MFDRNRGNLGVCETLWDKHDAQRDAADKILYDPFVVIVGKPLGNGELLDDVVNGGRGKSTRYRAHPAFPLVDVRVRLVGSDHTILGL